MSAGGRDARGCAFRAPGCRSLRYALDQYRVTCSRTGLYGVTIRADSPLLFNPHSLGRLLTIGDPHSGPRDPVTKVTFQANPKVRRTDVTFENVTFRSVDVYTDTRNIVVSDCTFLRSGIRSKWAEALTLSGSTWLSGSPQEGVVTAEVASKVKVTNCRVTTSGSQPLRWAFLSVKTCEFLEIRNFTAYDVTSAEEDNPGTLILLNNVRSCGLSELHVSNTTRLSGVVLHNMSQGCAIANSIFAFMNQTTKRVPVVVSVNSTLNVINTTFQNNTGSSIQAVDSDVDIYNCHFRFNRNLNPSPCSDLGCFRPGAVWVQRTPLAPKCTLRVRGSDFRFNEADIGAAVAVYDSCTLWLNGSRFEYNAAHAQGGAIFIQTPDETLILFNTTAEHVISDASFRLNRAVLSSGAVFHGCASAVRRSPRDAPNCVTNASHLLLQDSSFVNNSVSDDVADDSTGGGVAAFATTRLERCLFATNRAMTGGALYLYHTTCHLVDTTLINNTALYCSNVIHAQSSLVYVERCNITDRPGLEERRYLFNLYGNIHQMVFVSSFLQIRGLSVAMDIPRSGENDTKPRQTNMLEFIINPHPPPLPGGEKPQAKLRDVTLNCSKNYRVYAWSNVEFSDGCRGTELKDGSCYMEHSMKFVCEKPNKDQYVVEASFVIEDATTEPRSVEETLPAYYVNHVFKDCPTGATCTADEGITARPGYWGTRREEDRETRVAMVPCPAEVCCEGEACTSYCSCNDEFHRDNTSRLCCKCEPGYCEVLFSRECIPCQQCDSAGSYATVVVGTLVLVAVVVLAALLDKVDEVVFVCRLIHTSFKGSAAHYRPAGRHHSHVVHEPEAEAKRPEGPEAEELNAELNEGGMEGVAGVVETLEGHGHGRAHAHQEHPTPPPTPEDPWRIRVAVALSKCTFHDILPYVMMTIYFVQDTSVFHMSLSYCSHCGWLEWLDRFGLASLFKLDIDFLHLFSKLRRTCLASLAHNTALKEFVKHLGYAYIHVTFLVLFLIEHYCRNPRMRAWFEKHHTKRTLVGGFITVHLIIYQKLSSIAIKYVNCVTIDGQSVLHMDANQQCWGYTQYLAIAYLAICIVPFCVFIAFGCGLLERKVIGLSTFLWGMVFPGVVLSYAFVKWCCCWRNEARSHDNQNETPATPATDETPLLPTAPPGGSSSAGPPSYGATCAAAANQKEEPRADAGAASGGARKLQDPTGSGSHDGGEGTSGTGTGEKGTIEYEQQGDDEREPEHPTDPDPSASADQSEAGHQGNEDLTSFVIRNLQGSYTDGFLTKKLGFRFLWFGVFLGFRFALVAVSLWEHRLDSCAFALLDLCLARVLADVLTPYRTAGLRWTSLFFLSVLSFLALCNLVMAALVKMHVRECATDSLVRFMTCSGAIFTQFLPTFLAVTFAIYIVFCLVVKFLRWRGYFGGLEERQRAANHKAADNAVA